MRNQPKSLRMLTTAVTTVLISFTVLISSCSADHETMRGSVVMAFEKQAHICIGS